MTVDHLIDELDRDIWQPFVDAYAARDTAAFATLHALDLIRVEATNAWSGGLDRYLDRVGAFFDDMTAKGGRISIAFRFVERVAAERMASERGVYRIVMSLPDEGEKVFYGRFHTFARKVDDRWQIAVDYDTTENGTVGEADFERAATPS